MDSATIEANRHQQAALYGRPLGDIVRDLTGSLQISQARVAAILGMSAPMLSQLASAQRVKIGNPLAVSRLQSLLELTNRRLSPQDREKALDTIAAQATTITDRQPVTPGLPLAHALARVGTPEALRAAALAAHPSSPELAQLLRAAASLS